MRSCCSCSSLPEDMQFRPSCSTIITFDCVRGNFGIADHETTQVRATLSTSRTLYRIAIQSRDLENLRSPTPSTCVPFFS